MTHCLPSLRAQAQAPASLVIPDSTQPHLGGSMRGKLGDPQSYCPNLWAWAVGLLNVGSVVDIGCGQGHALKFFQDELGCEVAGVEGHRATIDSFVAHFPVHWHDYQEDGPLDLPQVYDLGWCCEFVEHVEEQYLENFFATFESCRTVLMTHATPGQGGHHHVNEQPAGYWLEKFQEHGFTYAEELTECARLVAVADKFILGLDKEPYFMKTGLVFQNTAL